MCEGVERFSDPKMILSVLVLVVCLLGDITTAEDPAPAAEPYDALGGVADTSPDLDSDYRGDLHERTKQRSLSAENICMPAIELDSISLDECASCKDRCGHVTNLTGEHTQCSCDRSCLLTRDCCWDFEGSCPDLYREAALLVNRSATVRAECAEAAITDGTHEAFWLLVVRCGSGELCDSPRAAFTHYDTRVPVADRDTGVVYRHLACALCNNVTNIESARMKMECGAVSTPDQPVDLTPIHDNFKGIPVISDVMMSVKAKVGCTIKYEFRDLPAKPCIPYTVSRCPSDCQNTKLINLCESPFQTYSNILAGTHYRNYYCALCHVGQDADLECHGDAHGHHSGVAVTPPSGALSLELDFQLDPTTSTLNISSADITCDTDKVNLPANWTCEELVCGRGHHLIHGGCHVVSTHNVTNTLHVRGIPCPKLTEAELASAERQITQDFRDQLLDRLPVLPPAVHVLADLQCVKTNDSISRLTAEVSLVLSEGAGDNSTQMEGEINDMWQVMSNQTLWSWLEIPENVTITLMTGDLVVFSGPKKPQKPTCVGVRYGPERATVIREGTHALIRGQGNYSRNFDKTEDGDLIICNETEPEERGRRFAFVTKNPLAIACLIVGSLSVLGLAARIVAQFVTDRYDTLPGRLQFNLSMALFCAMFFLLVGPYTRPEPDACATIAALKTYFYLTSSAWMVNIGFDTWYNFHSHETADLEWSSRYLWMYVLNGWCIPAVFPACALSFEYKTLPYRDTFKPHFIEGSCWFNEKISLLTFFGAPLGILLVANIVFYSVAAHALKRMLADECVAVAPSDRRVLFPPYVELLVLMMLTWICGCVATFVGNDILWYTYIMLHASQGIFVFSTFLVRDHCLRQYHKVDKILASGEAYSNNTTPTKV